MALPCVLILIVLVTTSAATPRRGKGGRPTVATTTPEATTNTAATTVDDDEIVTRVKGYIDAGTCNTVTTGSLCGDDGTSYYNVFEYNNYRVLIASGIPDHHAEDDAPHANPNVRCERWTYIAMPLSPTKGPSIITTGLGVIGYASSGGSIFNDLSNPDGSLAMIDEVDSLDSCNGHSNQVMQYHYHANAVCVDSSTDCVQIGYLRDGYPVYGYCTVDGVQLESCYTTTESVADADNQDDYTFTSSSSCQLDEANGYTFADGSYGYVMTSSHPYVPNGYYGSTVASLCSAD